MINLLKRGLMMYEVVVRCVLKEPITSRYVLMLETVDKNTLIPIYVGVFEAEAIYTELDNIRPPRPMTFDFITSIISALKGIEVEKIVIYDVDENCIYKSNIVLVHNNDKIEIDCRPSDALALGLRLNTPIYVEEVVLNNDRCIPKNLMEKEDRKVIENIIEDQETAYWNI